MATRLGKRPHPKNYATYDPKGKAQYRKDLAEYLKKKAAMEKEKNKLSTKKNIEKQKTSNKKASTAKPKTTAKTKVAPKTTATKAKSLATGKTTSKTKAVETVKTPKVTTTKRRAATSTTKKPVTKTPAAKKPAAKKPAAKKPPARKPPARKPAAKKPAGKVPAKKPLLNAKQKLRIKKGVTQTKNIIKKGVQKGSNFLKNQKAKFTAKDQTPQQANPEPKTKAQKLMSRLNKSYQQYKGEVTSKAKTDFGAKSKFREKLKDPSLKGQRKGATRASLAAGALTLASNALMDRAFKPKNMTLAEYRAAKEKANREGVQKFKKRIKRTAGNLVNKVRGKSNTQTSTTKNINKQKKSNNTGLKIKKTERSSKVNRNKDYNAKTATKKRNTALSEFRVDPKANRKLQLEAQNKKPITYSRQLSTQAKNQVSDTKKNKKKKVTGSSFKEKFIKTKSGSFARRGSVTARRAENREKARKRAQEMARKRLRK